MITVITTTPAEVIPAGARSLVLLQNLGSVDVTLDIDGGDETLTAGEDFCLVPKAAISLDGEQARERVRAVVATGTAKLLVITK